MNVELFIARRLYTMRKGQRRISRPATTIAQWGVSVGIVVMFVSLAIVVGFKNEVRDKIIGFGCHVIASNYEASANGDSFIIANDDDITALRNIDGVSNVQRFVQKPGLLAVGDEFEGVVVKGIGAEYDRSFFKEHLTDGFIPDEKDSIDGHWIVLSASMANKIQCKAGDKINVYFVNNGIRARRMLVTGVYETHLYEMDNIYALADINTTLRLNGWESNMASGIEMTVDEYENIEETRERIARVASVIAIKNEQRVFVQTIEEMNPALFAWLNVLDRTVWIILILVLGIGGFTMISGLLIIILEKSNFIGVMKAMGAQNASIRKIFLYYACFIIGKGIIIGNIIAIILCIIQQQTGIVALDPEIYYMDRVPIEFVWEMVPMNIIMFALSVAMLVVPSMLISRIEPSKAIKFE